MIAGSVLRTGRAIATNQLAGAFPRLYMRLAGQTGRGGDATPAETAEYFLACFDDLAARMRLDRAALIARVEARRVLEYGPGSIPGMAMLMLAAGATRVDVVDRFPLLERSPYTDAVLDELGGRLGGAEGRRLRTLARELTPHGIPGALGVALHPRGLSGLVDACDLVISRAVLEEVNDLRATFADMARALRAGGVAVHQVDLRSYGLHREHPLDFLVPSPSLWQLMYGNKCVPNRLRAGEYRRLARECGLDEVSFEPGVTLADREVEAIRERLWRDFRALPASELGCLTFWLVLRKGA
ncbi:MAG: methyltransferase domain-containing protein [Burkholderiales bacterium]|nr:methyltransferase domain-containing protein [Burkholderiales bacterium]